MITISCKILACNYINRIYSPGIINCFPKHICSIKLSLKDIDLTKLIVIKIIDNIPLKEFLKCIYLGHKLFLMLVKMLIITKILVLP